jgi:YggT family protein
MGMIDLSPIFAILTLIIIEMIMNQVAIVLLTGL